MLMQLLLLLLWMLLMLMLLLGMLLLLRMLLALPDGFIFEFHRVISETGSEPDS